MKILILTVDSCWVSLGIFGCESHIAILLFSMCPFFVYALKFLRFLLSMIYSSRNSSVAMKMSRFVSSLFCMTCLATLYVYKCHRFDMRSQQTREMTNSCLLRFKLHLSRNFSRDIKAILIVCSS